MDVVVDLQALPLSLVLDNTLRHGGHDTVVPPLDFIEALSELEIVHMQLRRPATTSVVDRSKISPCGVILP